MIRGFFGGKAIIYKAIILFFHDETTAAAVFDGYKQ
jgi:hypothetical protein